MKRIKQIMKKMFYKCNLNEDYIKSFKNNKNTTTIPKSSIFTEELKHYLKNKRKTI